jgi:hypothetical protein
MVTDTIESEAGAPVVYHLAGDAELRPAVALSRDLPDTVNGLQTFYYWKDAIVVGSYVHPTGGYSLDVTGDKLDRYVRTFSQMQSNGVGVPILMDHTATAAATLGWIVAVKRDGEKLMELHQFLGESARDVGLRNQVSLGIDPDFVDGKGNRYGEAIVHSAVTPVPVVPGQGGFEAADVSDGARVVMLSLKSPAKTQPAAEVVPAIEPPKGVVTEPDVATEAVRQVVMMKRDLAVARGGVDPASAGRLFDLLMNRPAAMTFSRTDPAGSVAAAVFDALAANRPVPVGEVTGLQVLSRLVPGDDRSVLQKQMIALASNGHPNF